MPVAITTKCLGYTATKGIRYKATAHGHTAIVTAEEVDGYEKCHMTAAKRLCQKLGWQGALVGGVMDDGNYAWVFTGKFNTDRFRVR